MATVYMICGNTGAGKSTYAAKLANEKNAVRFSIDPWMQALYGADYDPAIHSIDWLLERDGRCKALMRTLAERLLQLGVDVVFDLTFGSARMREEFRAWAAGQGAVPSLHYLEVPAEVRRQQVRQRNHQRGPTFAHEVTEEMFDYAESWFEPPTEDELAGGLRLAR